MRIGEDQFGEQISHFSRILYLCHRNADPDAIGSSFALAQAFGGSIGAIEDLSRTGASLAGAIGARPLINPALEDYDLVVVVDASVRMQIGDRLPSRYALVDHHLDTGLVDGALFYIQRPARSTAEIVWRILKENCKRADKKTAVALMAGMISDTGRFKRASTESFNAAAELLSVGELVYEEALLALSVPPSISQRIAVLKAASRAEIERQGDWLIAWTSVNSFEGSAAMALVDIGADVALVAGRHGSGNRVRVSGRSSWRAAKSGLSLAEIFGEVGREFGGDGGGHLSAAALDATGDPSAILNSCKRRAFAGLL